MTTVPFSALPGFNLQAELREVAAHYEVNWRALRASFDGRRTFERMAHARHALFFKLVRERGLSPARVAQLLGNVTRAAVLEGVKLHEKRIAEFRATCGLKGGQS